MQKSVRASDSFDLDGLEKRLRVLWFMFLATSGVIAAMPFLVVGTVSEVSLSSIFADPFSLIIVAIGVGEACLGLMLPHFFFRRPKVTTATLSTCYILRQVFFESCTLFGLVLSLTRQNAVLVIPFFVVTFAMTLLNYPSRDRFLRWSGAQHG